MIQALSIFVIDESMQLCRDLRGWLEEDGHAVNCCQVSNVLLPALQGMAPDLLIIAVKSYAGAGMQLLRRMVNHRELKHVPMIAVSEDADLEYEMLDLFDFQTRPFDRERLRKCLHKLTAEKRKATPLVSVTPAVLAEFKGFLLEHSALYFNQNNQRILERALLRRVQALRLDSASAYYQYLLDQAENYDELNKLVGLLTVGETSFFRYRSHRDALQYSVLPRLIEQKRNGCQLRIWSAGCSTGEEPYSVAILLLENFPELADWDVQVIATDINKRSLRQAREGDYGERSLRMMEAPLRERYFERAGSRYLLSRQVRNMVRFSYLNLKTDPFPEKIDLLLCRNVLIYFEIGTIRRIVGAFANSLNPEGFLFMGHSETMQNVSDRFYRHHKNNAFFYQLKRPEKVHGASPVDIVSKKEVRAGTSQQTTPPARLPDPVKVAPRPVQRGSSVDPERLYREAFMAFERERLSEADQLFSQLLAIQPQNSRALVGKGLVLAVRGKYAEARVLCAKAIQIDDLLPDAYFLRGLILDMEGFGERALVEYQKVLWLDADFVMAHYMSAKIYKESGALEKMRRSLRNTAKTLERHDDKQASIPYSGGLSRGVLLDIVHREIDSPSPS